MNDLLPTRWPDDILNQPEMTNAEMLIHLEAALRRLGKDENTIKETIDALREKPADVQEKEKEQTTKKINSIHDKLQLLQEYQDKLKELENSEEYAYLVNRRKELCIRIDIITDELFQGRGNIPNKHLIEIRKVHENNIKQIDEEIKQKKESIRELIQTKLKIIEVYQ